MRRGQGDYLFRRDDLGRIAIGGASGIGKAAAPIFAREGASVAIADLNREGGEAVEKDTRSAGG